MLLHVCMPEGRLVFGYLGRAALGGNAPAATGRGNASCQQMGAMEWSTLEYLSIIGGKGTKEGRAMKCISERMEPKLFEVVEDEDVKERSLCPLI